MKKFTILIVDDEKEISEIVSEFLENEDIQCERASSGLEAWEMLIKKQYDILITDIIMPEMSGLDLIKKIDAELKYKLPIFVMTGFTEYSKLKFLESRGSTIFQKSHEIKILIDAVHEKVATLSK